jgi:hypothetical protein
MNITGRWTLTIANDGYSRAAAYLCRVDDADPSSTVLFIDDEGKGTVANMEPDHIGDWWVMPFVTFGPGFTPALPRYIDLARSAKSAQFMNCYYQDYLARFTIHEDATLTAIDWTVDDVRATRRNVPSH